MLDEQTVGLEPEGLSLSLGGVDEYFASNKYTRNPSSFEIGDVVHTTRRATASISERFDYGVAIRSYFVAQIDWSRFGKRRLGVAADLGPMC